MKIKKDIADLKAFMDNIEDEVVDWMKKPTKHLLSKRQLDYYLANATI